jgi:hypothetical protein
MIPFIYNGNGTISLMIDGKMKPVDTAHRFYAEIKEALQAKEWDKIPGLVNIVDRVETAINNSTNTGSVSIRSGEVFYNGIRINNSLTTRIVDMAKNGFDIGFMVKFLENLMQNPSNRAVNELYGFLEAGAIPITENGTFLAYKKIRNDWKDIYSNTMDNSIGKVVSMVRNMVNEDKDQTCSSGLHVCSYSYLPHFGDSNNSRVVVVEVCPSAVVAVPADYKNAKMRVCEYTVVGEVTDYTTNEVLAKSAVVSTTSTSNGFTSPKNIGKRLTQLLDDEELSFDELSEVFEACGLNTSTVDFLDGLVWEQEETSNKRVGKKVAYFIENGKMDSAPLLALLNAA